jgi:hypothetical protein
MTSKSQTGKRLHASTAREHAITIDEVPRVFDDACFRRLARMGKMSSDANLEVFATTLQDGLRRYAQTTRAPSSSSVHQHIAALEKAASRKKYDRVADLLWSPLSAAEAARNCLRERLTTPAWRGRGVTLPSAAALQDPNLRTEACELIRRLCTVDAKPHPGRLRPTGKQSRSTIKVQLYGPTPSTCVSKRDAERELVTSVQDAYLRAHDYKPPYAVWTANPDFPNPFAQMTQEVLDLARVPRAPRADAVGLINGLNNRRRKRKPDWRKLLMPPLSTNNS